MNFPKTIYERCVLHDIFAEISCLEHFRLDQRVTTMYNYGVVDKSYVIIMKKYDCSLRDYVVKLREEKELKNKWREIIEIFADVLDIVRLLHEENVTHYDIKADNILISF